MPMGRTAVRPVARSPRKAGEGDYGVRKRSFRLMLKLRFRTPNRSACGSPLSRKAGEGLGVRG
jgi:hypothetical protein